MRIKQSKENFIKILRDAGLKSTIHRLAILKLLSELKHPMTAQEIHKKIRSLDLVTLYRTLSSFEKSGLIRQVTVSKNATYYERNLHDHHHIVCTECKKVSDFVGCEPKSIINRALKQVNDFKTISYHSFDLFGVCNSCLRK